MKYEDFKMPVSKTENILDDIVRYNKNFIATNCNEFNDIDKSCDRLKEKKTNYELLASIPLLIIGMVYLLCWVIATSSYPAKIGFNWKFTQYVIKIHHMPIKNWFLVSLPFIFIAFIAIYYGVAINRCESELHKCKKDLKNIYETTGLNFPKWLYGWIHSNWDKMTSDQYVKEVERHDDYTQNRVIAHVGENFPYVSKMQELKNLSDEYEYMCTKKTDSSITFDAFQDGQKIDDKSFTIDVEPQYQERASHGDFTFIDDVWNKIHYKILM